MAKKKTIRKRTRTKTAGREKSIKDRIAYNKRLKSAPVSPTVPEDESIPSSPLYGTDTVPGDFESSSTLPIKSHAGTRVWSNVLNITNLIVGIIVAVVLGGIALLYFFMNFQSQLTENSTNIDNIDKNVMNLKIHTTERVNSLEKNILDDIKKLDYDIDRLEDKVDMITINEREGK